MPTCASQKLAGKKVSNRLRRPISDGMAFSMVRDPFAAYGTMSRTIRIMAKVEEKLIACKPRQGLLEWRTSLINLVAPRIVAAKGWDAWLEAAGGETRRSVLSHLPASARWIDTFALPRRVNKMKRPTSGSTSDAAENGGQDHPSPPDFTAFQGAQKPFVDRNFKASSRAA